MNGLNENKAVGLLSELLALERGYTPARARQIRHAAVLHDIGKRRIPESILNKPDRLNEREFEIMKTHTKIGAEIASSIQGALGEQAKMICLFHHEWESGDGYWGIPARYLPDYVSFVSITDAYCALIAERPYKNGWSSEEAIAYIRSQSGSQFSGDLVKVFISLIQNDARAREICESVKASNYLNGGIF